MLMKNRIRWGIICVFLLIGSASFGMFSENSRQGSDPIFSITDQGIQLLNPAPDLGSEDTDGKNCVRLNNLAKVLTPYLYTGRRLDSFTGNYNNRNRYYSSKYGRFVSRDPIGFIGGNNLYAYANLNPARFTDPWGLMPWSDAQKQGIDFLDWWKRNDTSDCDRKGNEGAYYDFVENLAFQQPGSAEFEFLLGFLSAKDLIKKGASHTWDELKRIFRDRRGGIKIPGQTTSENLIKKTLKISDQDFNRAIHKIKKQVEGNPNMRFDLMTGDVFDQRSGEWVGNLLDYIRR